MVYLLRIIQIFKLLIFTNNKLFNKSESNLYKIIYLNNNYENWYINNLDDRLNLYKEILINFIKI